MVASLGITVISFLLTLQPALALTPGTSHNNVLARQVVSFGIQPGSIPSSCLSSSCQPLVNADSESCSDIYSCICTTTLANALTSCLQCAVNAGGSYTQTDADSLVSGYENGCADNGSPISGVSTSGGTSGSSGGSGSNGGDAGDDTTATSTTPTSTTPSSTTATGTDTNTATNAGASTLGGTSGSSGGDSGGDDDGGSGDDTTATGTTATGTGANAGAANTATATASGNTGGSPNLSAASNVDVGAFGVIVITALGAIALL